MNQEYGSEYAQLYANHWWWRARESILLREIRQLDLPQPAEILDVGCGDAVFFPALSQFGNVRGIEVDRDLVRSDNPYRYAIHHGLLGDAQYTGWQFDLITALDVIEHIEDDAAAVQHMFDMLRPGGHLVLTVPAFMLLWDAHDERNHHYRRYSRGGLRKLLSGPGEIRELRFLFHHTFFLKACFKLANRFSGSQMVQHTLPSSTVNRSMTALCLAEYRALSWMHVPFGTSLLAIIKKPK